jgi:hypothetical protein
MRLQQRIGMGWVFVVVSASVALGQARGKADDVLLAADVAWEKVYAAKDLAAKPRFGLQHTDLWNAYKDHPDTLFKQVGVKGDRLREVRVWADYNSNNKLKNFNPRTDNGKNNCIIPPKLLESLPPGR